MAMRAFALPLSAAPGFDNSKIEIEYKVVILGSDRGTYGAGEFNLLVLGLDPNNMVTLRAAAASAVQTDMEAHGITFSGGDTVLVN